MHGAYFAADLKNRKALLFDAGDTRTNMSTLRLTGLATAKVLSLPETAPVGQPSLNIYKNKMVYLHSFQVRQHNMLPAAQKVVGKDGWGITNKRVEKHTREGRDSLAAGDRSGVMNIIYGSIFTKDVDDSPTEPMANEILGLPKHEFEEVTKQGHRDHCL